MLNYHWGTNKIIWILNYEQNKSEKYEIMHISKMNVRKAKGDSVSSETQVSK